MENEKKHSFGKGVFIGIVGTCGVMLLALFIITGVLDKNLTIGAQGVRGKQNAEESKLLTDDVERKINELAGYINLYFYEDVDKEKIVEGMYSGMMKGLDDKYTAYYTPEEYADLQINATQKYYGIGAALLQDRKTGEVTVSHVYEGSPAEQAGLKDGDFILQVEDIEAAETDLSELVTHIRGEEGTKVHIRFYRQGEKQDREIDVKRANIDLPTVEYEMLEGGIGYIHILEFGSPTAKQFKKAVEDLKQQGMKAMLFDVRDNPGGMVTAVTEILDEILPKGTVVYTQDKYGKKENYTSDAEHFLDYPIAVLMNGNSASASEIFAGAIRDFEYGTLIGTNTFGKGVVQTIISLKDGDAIKLTTAKYYTPKGENIHGTGIKPDIEEEFDYQGDVNAPYDKMQDSQVQKAMEVLEEKIDHGTAEH